MLCPNCRKTFTNHQYGLYRHLMTSPACMEEARFHEKTRRLIELFERPDRKREYAPRKTTKTRKKELTKGEAAR